jgi:hypothetical protein
VGIAPFENLKTVNFFFRDWDGGERAPKRRFRTRMGFYHPSCGNSFLKYFIEIKLDIHLSTLYIIFIDIFT